MVLVLAGVAAAGAVALWASSRRQSVLPSPPVPSPVPSQSQPPSTTPGAQGDGRGGANIAPPSTGGAAVGAQGAGGLSAGNLGAGLALAIVDKAIVNESTRRVVPYVAAGVAAAAMAIAAGVAGGASIFGPVGIAVALAVVLVVGVVTVAIDAIVTTVKEGDWRNLSLELRKLRNEQLDAKAAIDLYRSAVVEMELGFDVRAVPGAVGYIGAPFCPSPLTWHELKQAPARAPTELFLRPPGAPEGVTQRFPAPGQALGDFAAALRKDVADVRALGLDPAGYGLTGVDGLTTSAGQFVRRTVGQRDIRGAVFPLWWFDARYREEAKRSAGVPEYDRRAAALKEFAAKLGGTARDDWRDERGYLGFMPGGLCYWLSERAALWWVGGRDQLPEMPSVCTSSGVVYANDGDGFNVRASEWYALAAGAKLQPRGWEPAPTEAGRLLQAQLEAAGRGPTVNAEFETWLRGKVARGERFHVDDDPNFWPVPLTQAEADMDRWRLLHPELMVPQSWSEQPPPNTAAARAASGELVTGAVMMVDTLEDQAAAETARASTAGARAIYGARGRATANVNLSKQSQNIEAQKARAAQQASAPAQVNTNNEQPRSGGGRTR